MLHQDPGSARGSARNLSNIAHGLLGIPPEELCGVGHFAPCVSQTFAVLAGNESSKVLALTHDNLIRPAQHLGALARLFRSPGRECLLRRIYRPRCIFNRRAGY